MAERVVPRETLEQQTDRAHRALAELLAIASERRAKMTTTDQVKRGGRAA